MFEKIVDITQASFAGLAFIAILAVSTLSVVALNPNTNNGVQQEGSVAGESREVPVKSSVQRISVNNTSINTKSYSSYLEKLSFSEYSYTSTLQSGEGIKSYNFVEVMNNNNSDYELSLKLFLSGFVQDDIIIRVRDGADTYTLYSPITGPQDIKLKIRRESTVNLTVEFEFTKKINFPFDVKFLLK